MSPGLEVIYIIITPLRKEWFSRCPLMRILTEPGWNFELQFTGSFLASGCLMSLNPPMEEMAPVIDFTPYLSLLRQRRSAWS